MSFAFPWRAPPVADWPGIACVKGRAEGRRGGVGGREVWRQSHGDVEQPLVAVRARRAPVGSASVSLLVGVGEKELSARSLEPRGEILSSFWDQTVSLQLMLH